MGDEVDGDRLFEVAEPDEVLVVRAPAGAGKTFRAYDQGAWQRAGRTGADLLWRMKDNIGLEAVKTISEAPAADLAAAYTQRWEIETAFDELKTHQRGPRAVLRSKSPDLVTQEIWGHLCCHYAIRALMFDAAAHAGRDPDRVSFVAALRISRRSIAQAGAFPP